MSQMLGRTTKRKVNSQKTPDPIFIPNLNARDGAASESMPLRKFGVLHQILLRGCEDGDLTRTKVTVRLQEERKTILKKLPTTLTRTINMWPSEVRVARFRSYKRSGWVLKKL